MGVHEVLPFVGYGFQIAKVPGFGGVFAGEVAVEVDSVVELLLCQGLRSTPWRRILRGKGRREWDKERNSQLGMKYHIQLLTIRPYSFNDLLHIANPRHLTHRKRIILLQDSPQTLQIFMQSRPSSIILNARPIGRLRIDNFGIGKSHVFADEV
jgi:hypothetical protein